MNQQKSRRVVSAVGFISGVLACLDAVRDTRVLWPPAVLWQVLRPPQRLEFGAGIALIAVTLITTAMRA
jgi:hypothetical protein